MKIQGNEAFLFTSDHYIFDIFYIDTQISVQRGDEDDFRIQSLTVFEEIIEQSISDRIQRFCFRVFFGLRESLGAEGAVINAIPFDDSCLSIRKQKLRILFGYCFLYRRLTGTQINTIQNSKKEAAQQRKF